MGPPWPSKLGELDLKFAPPIKPGAAATEIAVLKNEWGPGADPQGWQPNLRVEWGVLDRFLRGRARNETPEGRLTAS
jgi:hypothetical protein